MFISVNKKLKFNFLLWTFILVFLLSCIDLQTALGISFDECLYPTSHVDPPPGRGPGIGNAPEAVITEALSKDRDSGEDQSAERRLLDFGLHYGVIDFGSMRLLPVYIHGSLYLFAINPDYRTLALLKQEVSFTVVDFPISGLVCLKVDQEILESVVDPNQLIVLETMADKTGDPFRRALYKLKHFIAEISLYSVTDSEITDSEFKFAIDRSNSSFVITILSYVRNYILRNYTRLRIILALIGFNTEKILARLINILKICIVKVSRGLNPRVVGGYLVKAIKSIGDINVLEILKNTGEYFSAFGDWLVGIFLDRRRAGAFTSAVLLGLVAPALADRSPEHFSKYGICQNHYAEVEFITQLELEVPTGDPVEILKDTEADYFKKAAAINILLKKEVSYSDIINYLDPDKDRELIKLVKKAQQENAINIGLEVIWTTRGKINPVTDGPSGFSEASNYAVKEVNLVLTTPSGTTYKIKAGRVINSGLFNSRFFRGSARFSSDDGRFYWEPSATYFLGEPAPWRQNPIPALRFASKQGLQAGKLFCDSNLFIDWSLASGVVNPYYLHTCGIRTDGKISEDWGGSLALAGTGAYLGSPETAYSSLVPHRVGATLRYSDLLTFSAALDIPTLVLKKGGIKPLDNINLQLSGALTWEGLLLVVGYNYSTRGGPVGFDLRKPWVYAQYATPFGLAISFYGQYETNSTGLAYWAGYEGPEPSLRPGRRVPVNSSFAGLEGEVTIGFDFIRLYEYLRGDTARGGQSFAERIHTWGQFWDQNDAALPELSRDYSYQDDFSPEGTLYVGGTEYRFKVARSGERGLTPEYTFTNTETGEEFRYETPHLPFAVSGLLHDTQVFPNPGISIVSDDGTLIPVPMGENHYVNAMLGDSGADLSLPLESLGGALQGPDMSAPKPTPVYPPYSEACLYDLIAVNADISYPQALPENVLKELWRVISEIDQKLRNYFSKSGGDSVTFNDLEFHREFVLEIKGTGKYYKLQIEYKGGKLSMIVITETVPPEIPEESDASEVNEGLIANGDLKILCGRLKQQKKTITDLRNEIDKAVIVKRLRGLLESKREILGDAASAVEAAIIDFENYDIKEFDAIVIGRHKVQSRKQWLLGFDSTSPDLQKTIGKIFRQSTLGYAREALDGLVGNALLEYLLHEPLCKHVGHYEAREIQELMFEYTNYRDITGDKGRKNGPVTDVLSDIIKYGYYEDPSILVNINSASWIQLREYLGLTSDESLAVTRGGPYRKISDLRSVLSDETYERIRRSIFIPDKLAEKININEATEEEIKEYLQVNAKVARRIIDSRTYRSIYELKDTKGIGRLTFERLKRKVYVENDIVLNYRIPEDLLEFMNSVPILVIKELLRLNKSQLKQIEDSRPFVIITLLLG